MQIDDDRILLLKDNLLWANQRLELSKKQNLLCADMLANELLQSHPNSSCSALYEMFSKQTGDLLPTSVACFCRALALQRKKEPSLAPSELFGINNEPLAGSHGKIAYIRNRYNEQAFDAFSLIIPNTKSIFVSNFNEACEEVFNGHCCYCILPVENNVSGRLFGFYELLDRYELKICAVTSVEGDDSYESVLYALVGRVPIRSSASTLRILEFSLPREDGSCLGKLLQVAKELQVTPQKIDFLPLEYDRNLYTIFFNVRLDLEHASAFGLYLSLTYPNYRPIGFYEKESG